MLEYIKGVLTESSPYKATVEIQGIGYGLFIPLNAYPKLPAFGQMITFYLSTVIREDSHKTFGFLTRVERDLFEKLHDVSGIGPKTALALIGHLEISELQLAIAQADITTISKVPGIGKKTAERLVVDLRDKLKSFSDILSLNTINESKGVISDAINALIHLGYNSSQAQKAINIALKNSGKEPPLSELITLALRSI